MHVITSRARSNHSPDVFKYMEFIMTMILQESEDISSELLSPLLDSVRKENQNVSPMSWELGEKVIKNCAAELKPYLIKEVQSMGIVLKDYAQVVTSICENEFHMAEQSHVHGPEEHVVAVESVCAAEVGSVVDGSKSISTVDIAETRNANTMKVAVESVCAAEVGSVVDGSKSILTVDIAETRNDDTMKVAVESVCAAEVGSVVDGSNSILTVDIAETRNDDTTKAVKSGNDPETVPKKRRRRPNSLMTAEEGYDRSWINNKRKNPKVAVKSVCAAEVGSVVDGSKSILTVDIAETRNDDTMKAVKSVAVESICAAEVGSVVDGSKSILTVGIAETRNDNTMKAVKSVAVESVYAAEVGSVVDGSKSILTVDIAETRNDDTMKAVKSVTVESVCAAEVGSVVDRSKSILTVDIAETRNDDTMKAVKSGNDPETVLKKRGRRPNSLMTAEEGYDRSWITSRRKNPKAFETPDIIGEQLIGTRIRVWWPKDKMFYEGVVDSFDHIKKKHKILYDDGDVEILNLTTQRWELIQDGQMPVEGKQEDIQSHDALLKCRKRKRKSQSVPSSKHERKSLSVPSFKHEKADSRIEASAGKLTDGSTSDDNII